jgi:hypothetical protein
MRVGLGRRIDARPQRRGDRKRDLGRLAVALVAVLGCGEGEPAPRIALDRRWTFHRAAEQDRVADAAAREIEQIEGEPRFAAHRVTQRISGMLRFAPRMEAAFVDGVEVFDVARGIARGERLLAVLGLAGPRRPDPSLSTCCSNSSRGTLATRSAVMRWRSERPASAPVFFRRISAGPVTIFGHPRMLRLDLSEQLATASNCAIYGKVGVHRCK